MITAFTFIAREHIPTTTGGRKILINFLGEYYLKGEDCSHKNNLYVTV